MKWWFFCVFFSCCLPVPNEEYEGKTVRSEVEAESKTKKQRNERMNQSKKKQRKEAKRLKKEMADRKRTEEKGLKNLEMAVPEVQRVEMAIHPVDVALKVEMANASADHSPTVAVVAAVMTHASTDTSPAIVLDCVDIANASAEAPLTARPVSRPRLDWHKTLQPGRYDLTPEERDQLEEERRRRLLGWFTRREAAKEQANASRDASPEVVLDSVEMGNASTEALDIEAPLTARPMSRQILDQKNYQPRVDRGEQQTLQPGRCNNLTPAERDQLEEERRIRLLGWFKRREAAKEKAKTVDSISEPEKPAEKEALETVPEKEQQADDGEKEADMRGNKDSDSAGEPPSGIMGDVSSHSNLSCKSNVLSTLPSSNINLSHLHCILSLQNCLSSYILGMFLV